MTMPSNAYENLPEGVEGRAFQEFRAADDDSDVLEGHAATFGDVYDVGPFREKIAPGAFDGVLDDDVLALRDHNPSLLLGRTTSGTLELEVDETGLKSRIHLPDTADGDTVRTLVERGDLHHMSFAFEVEEDSWEKTPQGELRTIESVRKLYDVSPVSMPANPNTDVALRMRDAQREDEDDAEDRVLGVDADEVSGDPVEALDEAIRQAEESPDRAVRVSVEFLREWREAVPGPNTISIKPPFAAARDEMWKDLLDASTRAETKDEDADEARDDSDPEPEEADDSEDENAVDVGTLKRKLALEQAKVE